MKAHLFSPLLIMLGFASIACAQSTTAHVVGRNVSGMKRYAKMYKQENLGKSDYTCVYNYEVKIPESKSDRILKDQMILVANKEVSLFLRYSSYQTDSVINLRNREKITIQEYDSIKSLFPNGYNISTNIYKYHSKSILKERGRVFTDNYIYSETIPSFVWQMSDETEIIQGHSCHLSRMHFRGRDWKIWYADDIPLSDGPWKFCGLPGLVLKAESEDGEISFSATWVAKRNVDILCNITEKSDFKTTREKYLKFLKQYKSTPASLMAGTVEVEGGLKKASSLPYNPIEKE